MADASGSGPRGDQPTVRAEPTEPVSSFNEQVRAARTEFELQVAQARAEFEEANERIKQRTGRDLILAIVIGLAIGALLLGSLLFWKPLFVLLGLAACAFAILELHRAFLGAGRRVDLTPQLIAGAGLLLTAFFLDSWLHWVVTIVAVAFVIVWRLMAQMARGDGRTYGDVLADVLVAGLIQLYVPFLASICMVLLRQDGGQWWVLAFIIVAVAADTGAYATGITIGRRAGARPMAPLISPKKTWDGFVGAVLSAVVAGVLLALFMLELPWWAGIVFGLAILGSATVGDLGESMIKRDIGIKDMSSWLPGHGGVLDRLDSILPSATVALALFYLLGPLAAA